MSFLPRVSSGTKKVSSHTGRLYNDYSSGARVTETSELRLPTIDVGIHGDGGASVNNGRPQTVTLNRPRVLYNQLAMNSENTKNSPFKVCHFCGREFGSASIGIHEKQCQQKRHTSVKTEAKGKHLPPQTVKDSLLPELRKVLPVSVGTRLATGETSCRGDTDARSTWKPFSCKCQFCGEKYGKHSVAMHEGRCPQNPLISAHDMDVKNLMDNKARRPVMRKSASIVNKSLDVGFGPTQQEELNLPPRPETRTLNHSSLHLYTGYEVVKVPTSCGQCGKEIAADQVVVHSRMCKPQSQVSTGSITFPTLPKLLRTESVSSTCTISDMDSRPKVIKKPPSVVCYICGREYGTKSIEIHEPQCLKKWKIENSKLSISERKPLPRKPEKRPKLARVVSTESSITVQSLPQGRDIYPNEVMEEYFQHCYAEFQKELLPCKKCGRTFAPERHVKHIRNCNAKPLPSKGK